MEPFDFVAQEDAALADEIRAADLVRLRWISIRAAEVALEANGLMEFVPLANRDWTDLEHARAEAEASYWEIQRGDDGPNGEAVLVDLAFTRERALTAACATKEPDPATAAASAVYEALFALNDRDTLRDAIIGVPTP
jgi:hypothetical protein